MPPEKEIRALLMLLDDPDVEVYDTVAEKIMGYGREIIPALEQLWEVTPDEDTQKRIEELIHRVQFHDLQEEFYEWSRVPQPDLLRGAILLAKYQYPEMNVPAVLNLFDQIRRNIWLELNSFLSPPDQVNVMNSIFYSFYKFKGHELTERDPNHFFINHVLDSRQGNAYTIGIMYLTVCELLDIPLFAINLPRQFIFAYIHITLQQLQNDDYSQNRILFYLDPVNGNLFSQNDIDAYLHKINAYGTDLWKAPISNTRVIYLMMEELSLCYRYLREDSKADDIQQLMKILMASED